MKKWYGLVLLLGCILLNAEVVYESDFSKMEKLTGWVDLTRKTPDEKNFTIVTENGESFLRTGGAFGICGRLPKRIVVDGTTGKIRVTVMARKDQNNARLFSFALTSREFPEGGAGGAFSKGKDSGFFMNGYHHSNRDANFIAWRKDGEQIQMPVPKEPFILIPPKFGEWLTLTLVYDHAEKELRFFNGTSEEPVLVQRNVDLGGVPLDSVWLRPGIDYQKVAVSVEPAGS